MKPVAALLVLALVAGCAGLDRDHTATGLASAAGMTRMEIEAGQFVLTAFARITDPGRPLVVYIEGDGLAWLSKTEPARDPTPVNPVGLSLAVADPSANVAWLARPCQYTGLRLSAACAPAYWTGRRLAPEVIAALDLAISRLASATTGQLVHLVGYSGGGGAAVLIAAGRKDVASIRTVAGNLDLGAFTRLHGVSPMAGSLDPLQVARAVAHIPQIHFRGAEDDTVPPALAQNFLAAAGSDCVTIRVVARTGHMDGWATQWPRLVNDRPKCP